MFKKLSLIGAALAMTGTALVPATEAAAQSRYEYRDGRGYQRDGYREYRRDDRRYNYRSRAADKCRDGDGGTIVGAIAGGLAGNALAGRGGDRALGTILGGVVGALAGREIDRSDRPGYCRR